MPRPNPLADDDFCQLVSEAFASGMSRTQMCSEFGVRDKATITRWRRDARVKARVLKLIEDRVLEVTRKVDSEIAQRLQEAGELTTRELLMIRREFLGGALRAQTERADDATISEAAEALENNPRLLEDFEALLARQPMVPANDSPFEEPIGDK